MGRRSIKSDKSVYQQKREELGYSREEASAQMATVSPERLERLENGRVIMQPEDVLELSKGYHAPELCTYYCSHDCPIGEVSGRDVRLKDLSQIAVETLGALGKVDSLQARLLEIVSDGKITPDEFSDFAMIEENLEKIALSIDSLKLWIRNQKANGKLPENLS